MNHELGGTSGVTRAHGSKGAFVSEWRIDKATGMVLLGRDLIQSVNTWNGGGYSNGTATFNRSVRRTSPTSRPSTTPPPALEPPSVCS